MMKKIMIGFCFVAVFIQTQNTLAQDSEKEILRQKTEIRLREIIDRSSAITGLTAIDLKTGETTFSFNPDISFPQASAIKIPILMEIYKQAYDGKIKLSNERAIKPENVVGGTGIVKDLAGPVSLSIRNISVLMIALSDNTATNSLIDLVGMAGVNNTLKSLGFRKTVLQRKMMNAEASGNGQENLSTPAEAAKILKMLYNGEFVNKDISSEIISVLKKPARSESRLAAGIPDEVPIAFKPGGLSGVSTEWAIILLRGRPYVVAIMENYKWGTKKGRVMEAISHILYQYYWRVGHATDYGTYVDPSQIR